MDRLNVNEKAPKQANSSKNQPIKVVYISNPMKVEASTDDFRAIVQELTGRDSEIDDTLNFLPFTSATETSPVAAPFLREPSPDPATNCCTADFPFDELDEAFASQILETFTPKPAMYRETKVESSREADSM